MRPPLSSNTSFFVSTTGSDAADGLTSATAWATLQHAWSIIRSLDLCGFCVTVNVADGTYAPFSPIGPIVGGASTGSVIFIGNHTTPGNCVILATTGDAVYAAYTSFSMDGFCVRATGAGFARGIVADNAYIDLLAFDFGWCGFAHMQSIGNMARISMTQNYSISAGSQVHALAELHGEIEIQNRVVTLSYPTNFSNAFCLVDQCAVCEWTGTHFTGVGATGRAFDVSSNGVLVLDGVPSGALPGNAQGVVTTGGQVV